MPPARRPTIWARCALDAQVDAITGIASKLRDEGEDFRLLITLPDTRTTPEILAHPLGPRALRKFLEVQKPQMLIWIGGELDLAALTTCHSQGIPVLIVNATPDANLTRRSRWRQGRLRAAIAPVAAIMTETSAEADTYVKAGAHPDVVQHTGAFENAASILPYHEAERYDLATVIGVRQIWAAVHVRKSEAQTLADAHRRAARRAHRLLMICVPDNPDEGSEIATVLRDESLTVTLRSEGAEPDDTTQVYVADVPGELGLWYRLAPLSYIGGTMGYGAGDNPFHAAALGSVVIHGPAFGPYRNQFARLEKAGAARSIKTPTELGEAVAELLSPDRAASYAAAGWDVTSSSADVAERLQVLIQDRLDQVGR